MDEEECKVSAGGGEDVGWRGRKEEVETMEERGRGQEGGREL